MEIIVVIAIIVFLILWVISCRQRLAIMDENVNNAMAQIGLQLSSYFDVLTALLDLTKEYATHESQTMIETIKSHRRAIATVSMPDDVLKQERVISEALGRIFLMAERYPELKTNENYIKYINTVSSYKLILCTSRLIYNDSVTKLNRELRMFPISLLAGIFGFRQRDYFDTVENSHRTATRA